MMKKTIFILLFYFHGLTLLHAQNDTVIAIHGLLGSTASMEPIRSTLTCSGCSICLWSYPSKDKYIEEHAICLVSFLQQLASQSPGQPIHFVTHSIGALVLRAALNMPGCPNEARIGKAVLLAPPNKGALLARKFRNFLPLRLILGDKVGRQLMTMEPCDFIRCFGNFPETMEVFVIAGTRGIKPFFSGPNDGLIAVEETALETPYICKTFYLKHGRLLTNTAVLFEIKNFILQCPQ